MKLLSRFSQLPKQFNILFWLTQVTGIILCAIVMVWVFYYRGGVGWTEARQEFNWHIVSFTIGMIYLYANGMIIFRFLPWIPKKQLKLIHTGILTCVIVSMVFGMYTVIDCYANSPTKRHFTSMHAWLGILSMLLFVGEWAVSIYIYLYPGASSSIRISFMPLHIFLGVITFACTIGATLLGFAPYTRSVKNYQELPPEALILNCIPLLLVVFASLTVYLLYKNEFKRTTMAQVYKHNESFTKYDSNVDTEISLETNNK